MNNDYGFENRKAYLERARNEHILNRTNEPKIINSHIPKKVVAMHKQARFENTIKMSNMHKENFNMNFNK